MGSGGSSLSALRRKALSCMRTKPEKHRITVTSSCWSVTQRHAGQGLMMPIRPTRSILCRAYRLNRLNRIDTLCNRVGRHDRSSLQHRVNRERAQANSSWCRSDQGFSVHGSTVKMNSTETSLSAAGSETHNNKGTRRHMVEPFS